MCGRNMELCGTDSPVRCTDTWQLITITELVGEEDEKRRIDPSTLSLSFGDVVVVLRFGFARQFQTRDFGLAKNIIWVHERTHTTRAHESKQCVELCDIICPEWVQIISLNQVNQAGRRWWWWWRQKKDEHAKYRRMESSRKSK